MNKPINIGPLLDEIIKETGLTQEEIAKDLDYDPVYLSQARKAGTKKLYNRLILFIEEFRKSKVYKSKNPDLQGQDLHLELIESLKRENVLLRQQLDFLKDRVLLSLDQVSDDQYFFAGVHQAWQELWLEHIPMKPKVSLHEAKENVRTRVISIQHAAKGKDKEVFLTEHN